MIASELISPNISYLSPENTTSEAKAMLEDYCLCHLPIVKDNMLLGILPAEAINNELEQDRKLAEYKEDFILSWAHSQQHFLDIFKQIGDKELTLLPVVEQGNQYIGAIEIASLLNHFANLYSFNEPGGIFTLTIPYRNYDLSEISRIIESNNSKILSLFTQIDEDAYTLTVTIKVNSQDLKNLQATFERYDYYINVHQTYDTRADEMKERYDLLMKYIDT